MNNNKRIIKDLIPIVHKIIERLRGTSFELTWRRILRILESDRDFTDEQINTYKSTIDKLLEKRPELRQSMQEETICISDDDEDPKLKDDNKNYIIKTDGAISNLHSVVISDDEDISYKNEINTNENVEISYKNQGETSAIYQRGRSNTIDNEDNFSMNSNDTEAESIIKFIPSKKKRLKISDSSSSEEDIVRNKKKRRIIESSSSSLNNSSQSNSNELSSEDEEFVSAREEDTNSENSFGKVNAIKLIQFKNLLSDLSSKQKSNQTKILKMLEDVFGKEQLNNLKEILTNGSQRDERKVKNRKKKTRMTESEVLLASLKDMFYENGVTSFEGLGKRRCIKNIIFKNSDDSTNSDTEKYENDTEDSTQSFEEDSLTDSLPLTSNKPKILNSFRKCKRIVCNANTSDTEIDKKGENSGYDKTPVTENSNKITNAIEESTSLLNLLSTHENITGNDLSSEEETFFRPLTVQDYIVKVLVEKSDFTKYSMPAKIYEVNNVWKISDESLKSKNQNVVDIADEIQTCNTISTSLSQSNLVTLNETNEKNGMKSGYLLTEHSKSNVKTPKKKARDSKFRNSLILTSPSSKIVENSEHKISNISFTKCRKGVLFKCFARCSYNSVNVENFKYHLQSRHSLDKWCGFCDLCNKSLSNIKPLIDEFEHMFNVHIKEQKPSLLIATSSKQRRNSKETNGSSVSVFITKPKDVADVVEQTHDKDEGMKNHEKINVNENDNISERNSIQCQMKQPTLRVKKLPGDNLSKQSPCNHSEINQLQQQQQQQPSNALTVVKTHIPEQINSEEAITPSSTAQEPESNSSVVNVLSENSLVTTKSFTNIHFNDPSLMVTMQSLTFSKNSIDIEQMIPRNALTKSLPQNQSILTKSNDVNSILHIKKSLKNSTHMNNGIASISMKTLRPWLSIESIKSKNIISSMLELSCLVALYKCMNEKCDFYSSNIEIFLAHLRTHKNILPLQTLACSYCEFHTVDEKSLVNHIALEHGKCKYLCACCFYRTTSRYNATKHITKYHRKLAIAGILKLKISELNEEDEKKQILRNISKFVVPIKCPVCAAQFYTINAFENHHKKLHPSGLRFNCSFCKNEANEQTLKNHLKTCHKIHQYQCCYCKFGSENEDGISYHLVDNHANKLPFYFERASDEKIYPCSTDNSCLKMFSNKIM